MFFQEYNNLVRIPSNDRSIQGEEQMAMVGTFINIEEVQKLIGSYVQAMTKSGMTISGLFTGFNRWGDAAVLSPDEVEHACQVETLEEVPRNTLNEQLEVFMSKRVIEIRRERLQYVLRTLPKKYVAKSILD